MTKTQYVGMPRARCEICGATFLANTHDKLNTDLYHHGIDVHLMELRRAARDVDGSTDPIWVVDYLKGIDK